MTFKIDVAVFILVDDLHVKSKRELRVVGCHLKPFSFVAIRFPYTTFPFSICFVLHVLSSVFEVSSFCDCQIVLKGEKRHVFNNFMHMQAINWFPTLKRGLYCAS